MIIAIACFGVVLRRKSALGWWITGCARLKPWSSIHRPDSCWSRSRPSGPQWARVLATDIRTVSLFCRAQQDHRCRRGDRNCSPPFSLISTCHAAFTANCHPIPAFQWLRRQLTPKQQSRSLALGIPGIGFGRRPAVLPGAGPTASHVRGPRQYRQSRHRRNGELCRRAGARRPWPPPGMTSTRTWSRVKAAARLRGPARAAAGRSSLPPMDRYKAIAAAGVVLNVHNRRSRRHGRRCPDYDHEQSGRGADKDRLNRDVGRHLMKWARPSRRFTPIGAVDSGPRVGMD